jgi:glycosyltransferase involved in cell wall biosynthesis
MNIVSYSDLRYTTGRATGVYKHIDRVVHGLAGLPSVNLKVAVARDQLDGGGCIPSDNALADLPSHRLPVTLKQGRALWGLSSRPAIDRWVPADTDWVYSPQELLVPTSRARSAVTLHGLTYFEPAVGEAIYNSNAWRVGRARLGWFLRRVKATADRVLCVSAYLQRQVIERFGFDPAKTVVVGNGVEDHFFESRPAPASGPPEAEGRPYVLSVGGLNAFDGGTATLNAAAALHRKCPDLMVLIVGTLHEPELQARALGIPYVRLLGYVESRPLADLMRGAVALLALQTVESFGIVPLEAMAAGCPVVAGKDTALPETVGDGGQLVDARDPEVVATAVIELLASTSQHERWISSGRKHVERFRWQHAADRVAACMVF